MNALEASFCVLQKTGAPMQLKDIWNQIQAEGLWESRGSTPMQTVGAGIYSDIKANGDRSAFVKVGPNTFALRSWQSSVQSDNSSVPNAVVGGGTATVPAAPMSFTDSAQRVLNQFGNKKPMHYKEITDKAIAQGWLTTSGKTPAATMYAQIITDIRRQQKRGTIPRFVQHGNGLVGLSMWKGSALLDRIEHHNGDVQKALLQRLLDMKPVAFEELVSQLVALMGFEDVELTPLGGDKGIDVRGTLAVGDAIRIKMAIQVKRWKRGNNVQSPVVQAVRGSLAAHEHGAIITTSDFSAGAKKEAEHPNKARISLINGEQFVLLLIEHGMGVKRTTRDLYELEEGALINSQ